MKHGYKLNEHIGSFVIRVYTKKTILRLLKRLRCEECFAVLTIGIAIWQFGYKIKHGIDQTRTIYFYYAFLPSYHPVYLS